MSDSEHQKKLNKLTPGIPGLNGILSGGFPELSINIVSGPPGSGKTIFVQQIIYNNARPNRKALYLTTLSEPSLKMLHYLQKFSFFDPSKVGQSVIYLDIGEVIREKGLRNATSVIVRHVQDHKPAIVGIDSFKAIHDMARDSVEVRKFGFDLAVRLTTWGVTAFLVGEYTHREIEEEPIFAIADGIVCLHYKQQGLSYQRYVDIIKMRGEDYFNGLHPFTISRDGLMVYPRIKTPEHFPSVVIEPEVVSTGLEELDTMLQGGLPRGTATMVAGGAGSGKTLIGLHFITAGALQNEPGVIVTFQENPSQLRSIVRTFGWDLEDLERRGLLVHLYHSPVEIQPDVHAARVREAVERVGARRVLIDSIKDIEIATPDKVRFKDYIYSIVNEFKMKGITMILTNEIPELFGNFQLSEYGVSFIADNVILLRHVELSGRMEHAINILKVRGSSHSKDIRRFIITNDGIRIGTIIQGVSGILTGSPSFGHETELRNLSLRSRYVLEALTHLNMAYLDELTRFTGLSVEDISLELSNLEQMGIVVTTNKEGERLYRVSPLR